MVSPVHGDYRRCQAETPLIVLSRFPGPALGSLGGRQSEYLAKQEEQFPTSPVAAGD
jgi:hypothetical protein